MAKKIKNLIFALGLVLLSSSLMPIAASALPCTPSPSNPSCICSSQGCDDGKIAPAGNNCDTTVNKECLQQNPLVKDIQMGVNFLSAGVGIVVVGALILGGIQYSMAGGAPEAVTKAKQRITNALIAFAAFIFMFAFLQWLIPGGIFG